MSADPLSYTPGETVRRKRKNARNGRRSGGFNVSIKGQSDHMTALLPALINKLDKK